MKFTDHYTHEINTDLRPLEWVFNSLHAQNPSRQLDLPHEVASCRDILLKASQTTSDPLSSLLATTLNEDSFFHKDLDCEIYQHLRYLPCTWHKHAFLEVVCVMEGSCTNYILEQKIILRISTIETAFFGTLSENDILSDFFMRTLYNSKTHPFLLFSTNGDTEALNYVGYAYEEYKSNRQYRKRMLNSIINAFFIVLLRNHGANVFVPALTDSDKDQNLVYILKYMQEHFTTVSLKELAAFFNYSERQLQRIIKTSTGMSFSENILKLKMNHAARLLSNPDLPVAAIAEELGYSDTGNFRAVFKKYYGITPMEFRAQQSDRKR